MDIQRAKRYLIIPEDCLLLVIDIQDRLYNAMESDFREVFLNNGKILIETMHAFACPVVVTEQYPRGLGATLSDIGALIEGLHKYEKLAFSCCRDDNIASVIDDSGKKTVIVTGIETHVCVLQTVLDLLCRGYKVVVAADAVCSRRDYDRIYALDAMAGAGALVYTTEAIAFMLLERAGTDIFKKISPFLR